MLKAAWNSECKDGRAYHKMRNGLINTIKALKRWNRKEFRFVQPKLGC